MSLSDSFSLLHVKDAEIENIDFFKNGIFKWRSTFIMTFLVLMFHMGIELFRNIIVFKKNKNPGVQHLKLCYFYVKKAIFEHFSTFFHVFCYSQHYETIKF